MRPSGPGLNESSLNIPGHFLPQAKPQPKDIEALSDLLGLDKVRFNAESGDQWWPNRGAITPMPPTDPVLYRLYEVRENLTILHFYADGLV